MSKKTVAIPVTVQVKFWQSQRLWDVIDSIDLRNNESLGRLTSYGFDDSDTFIDQILIGVLDAILDKEQLDTDASYCVSVTVIENGSEIGSIATNFEGNSPPEVPKNWQVIHKKQIFRFLPYEDRNCEVVEGAQEYANRMRKTALPNFPEEVLIEWFHRAPRVIEDCAFLHYEALEFKKETWPVDALPGREGFTSEGTFDHLVSVFDSRLKNHNWLAEYMNSHGTWNTPIILIESVRIFTVSIWRKVQQSLSFT